MQLKNILLCLLVFSGVTLYMLSIATGVTSKLSDYFWLILGLNILPILYLSFVLVTQFWKIRQDVRNGVYGARLSRSMIKRFTLVAVLPGLFLFAISTQFILHSINTWFGNGTKEALDRSLSLSKVALNNFSEHTTEDAQIAGFKIKYGLVMGQAFDDIFSGIATDLSKFDQVAAMNTEGEFLISTPSNLSAPYVEATDWPAISNNPLYTNTEMVNDKLYIQIFLHIYLRNQKEFILFFKKKVPENIASDIRLIQNTNQNYAELTNQKQGLQTIFIITLLVSTLLSIFMALLAAIFFSRRFVEPLVALLNSTRAVSRGDFSKKNPIFGDDELGQLAEKFNVMTDQLQLERERSESLYAEQQQARQYFESVLLNLTTGVITLDANGYIRTYNLSVENIFNFSLQPYIAKAWQHWPSDDVHIGFLRAFIRKLLERLDGKPLEFEYSADDTIKILLGKAVSLEGGGAVMVFEDVTKLVLAQKEAAWGEVARRLAHEIKNPLTPIQLSAERVQAKLEAKLAVEDAKILRKSISIITKQVAALKEMVESFRNYSRLITLNLETIDLNNLVRDVSTMYEGIGCIFRLDLSEMPLCVSVDGTSIRQVLHNILKNASEAAREDAHPEVQVTTARIGSEAVLVVYNNGKSFSQSMMQHAFEPYVTDKVDGTGLGLAVVKKIIDEHAGKVVLSNRKEGPGACVKVTLGLVNES